MDITGNQTVRLRMPVATASEIDGSKKKGVFAFSTTDQTVAVCPEDGANFVRMGIHPADAPAATSLGGGDIVLIVQGGVLKRTTVSEIGGGGVWQPLDSDLTAIAALTTTSFGRSLLTLADAPSARSAIGAASSADLSGYQPLDSDLTAIAALTTTPFGRSLLALADGPAVRTAIGAGTVQPSDLSAYQPLDSDLTAIASLTTTLFGRSLLTVADAAAARSAIGAGTSSFSGAYSALSSIPAAIDAIDGLTPAADRLPYYTGASTGALATLTPFARTLLDDADAATFRATIGALAASLKGAANGVAELGVDVKVPVEQLPSAALLALGVTPTTAYRGDRGKIAYDHSQIAAGNPHGTTAADVGAMPAPIRITGAIDFNSINGGAPGIYQLEGSSYTNAPGGATSTTTYSLWQGVSGGRITQVLVDGWYGGMLHREQLGAYTNYWSVWAEIWDSIAVPTISLFAKSLLDDADATAARTTLNAAVKPSVGTQAGNWTLGTSTPTGTRQTGSGTLTLPAASPTYAGLSYTITASTTLTLTIAGTFCYLDAVNSASYWYDVTSGTQAFAMNGGHASGNRKKIEIWCDGTEWLVRC